MADTKKYVDFPALQEYDKGVKDALSKKAEKDHTHDYASAEHTHTEYADKDHDHDEDYANKEHDHDEDYAAIDSKELVKEVDTLETPTKDSNHVVFQEGKLYVRSFVIGDGISINPPNGVTTTDYPYYHIIHHNLGYRVVWTQTNNSIYQSVSGGYGDYSASIHISIYGQLYYSNLYVSIDDAITALKSSNTTYTHSAYGMNFLIGSSGGSSTDAYKTKYVFGFNPVIHSNSFTSYTYLSQVTFAVDGPHKSTETATVTPVDGVINDGTIFNEYKELATVDHEYEEITDEEIIAIFSGSSGTSSTTYEDGDTGKY